MSTRFEVRELPLAGLVVIDRTVIADSRGYLERLYSADELAPLVGDTAISQVNRTLTSKRGTVRGMHFQVPPHAEIKFVCCLRGAIFDVAVDLRRGSPTFLKWHGELLGGTGHSTLLIPQGFAHGFQTLADDCEVLYLHSAPYEPTAEGGVSPTDPTLSIHWPEAIMELSARDASHPMLKDGYEGIEL